MKPNVWIFYIACMLVPWTILGFDLNGMSNLQLSFLVILLDIHFWFDIAHYQFEKKVWQFLIILGLAAIWMSINANNPVSIYANFLMPLIYSTYIYFGLKNHSLKGLYAGIISSSLFSTFHWIEKYINLTNYLSIIHLEYKFKLGRFGLIQPSGEYAVSEFIKNIPRVSGTAVEPAILSLTFFLLIPIAQERKILLFFLMLGILVSFSKVSLVFCIVICLLYFVSKYIKIRYHLFVIFSAITYLVLGALFQLYFYDPADFLKKHASIYTRFLGATVFYLLKPIHQLLGVGKFQSCFFAPSSIQEVTEIGSGFIDFINARNCSLVNASNIGSILVDYGILGLIFWSIWPTLILSIVSSTNNSDKNNRLNIYLCCWFMSFLNIYFLSFFIPSYFFLSWVLWYASRDLV